MSTLILTVGILLALSGISEGQFLRLGPIAFDAQTSLEGVYTTNVEQERAEEATAEREDYFVVAALSLSGETRVSPSTSLRLDTGVSVEEHFNRSDLNNSSSPFANVSASTRTEFRHMSIALDGSYRRVSQSEDDVFVPGGRKKRDVHDIAEYGAAVEWAYRALSLGADYTFSRERHDEEEFQDGDEDETTIGAHAALQLSERISLSYDYERQRTELINEDVGVVNATGTVQQVAEDDQEEDAPWDDTHTVGLNVDLMRRPSLRYTLAYEKEDEGAEEGEWEITHTISLSDDLEFIRARNLTVSVNASYTFEEDEEEDDIDFTYGLTATHQVSSYVEHSLKITREPVDTFGSENDTDSTSAIYDIRLSDILFPGLELGFSIQYERDEPLGGNSEPTEKTWTYLASLTHSRMLNSKLRREFDYSYSQEDSNVEDEMLEEHRVTLSFIYDF